MQVMTNRRKGCHDGYIDLLSEIHVLFKDPTKLNKVICPYVKPQPKLRLPDKLSDYWIEDRRTRMSFISIQISSSRFANPRCQHDRYCLFRSLVWRIGSGCWSRFAGAKPGLSHPANPV